MTPELLGAWLRMLQLMERPQDIPALAPAYEREILYRVLQGPQGWMLRDIAAPDSALSQDTARHPLGSGSTMPKRSRSKNLLPSLP